MDFDVLAAAAVPAVRPPSPVHAPAARSQVETDPRHAVVHSPVAAAPPPRRVELSFHEDLRVLVTKVIDEQTGQTVMQLPARQVLAMVADVMKQIRTHEEG